MPYFHGVQDAPPRASPHAPHASATTRDLTVHVIEFERRLMAAMGITEHANGEALRWIERHADRVRTFLDTDAHLLALVRSERYDEAVAYIRPLLAAT